MREIYSFIGYSFYYDEGRDIFILDHAARGKFEFTRLDIIDAKEAIEGGAHYIPKPAYDAIPEIYWKASVIKGDSDTESLWLSARAFHRTIRTCADCASGSDTFFLLGKSVYCPDCFFALKKCAKCGKWESEKIGKNISGKFICGKCIEEYYTICPDCGKLYEKNRGRLVYENGEMKQVCESCLNEKYTRCMDCGYYYKNGETEEFQNGNLCKECRPQYSACERCGDMVDIDNLHTIRRSGRHLCESCYEETSNGGEYIRGHGSKLRPVFHGEGTKLFFGIEQEIDNGDERGECAESIHEISGEDNLYMESDGSLNDNGIELIYFPRTLNSWTEFLPTLQKISDTAGGFGYKSHETSTCGLHVHASRNAICSPEFPDIEENIGKMMILYDNNFEDFYKFSRRKSKGELSQWAKKPSDTYSYQEARRRQGKGKEIFEAAESERDRYFAINIRNSPTVEFRLFKGSLRPETVLACIALANAVIQCAISCNDEEIELLSFDDIVKKGENQYLTEFWDDRKARKTTKGD